ncbi:MAG TPA: hypothetical protein VM890_04365 [Longimicrobium sp.]|jgi:hypothetical protein|nr:hypothetical protein [Longimicrobium sp.]
MSNLSVNNLLVTSFETTSYELASLSPDTIPPEENCYSPYCVPTDLPEQCPDTTVQTAAE